MADPQVSTQNFLRLLLGGMQQGVDVFQQRQTQQQAQAPDLYMALQNMMRHKVEREQDVGFKERELRVGEGLLGVKKAEALKPTKEQSDVAAATTALTETIAAIEAAPLPPEVRKMLTANARAKAAMGQAPTIGSEGFQPLVSARIAKVAKDEEMAGKRLEFINELTKRGTPITPKDRVMASNLGITDLDKVAGRDVDPLKAIDALVLNISPEEKTVRKMIGDVEFSDVAKMTRPERWAYAANVYINDHPDLTLDQLKSIQVRLEALRKIGNAGE